MKKILCIFGITVLAISTLLFGLTSIAGAVDALGNLSKDDAAKTTMKVVVIIICMAISGFSVLGVLRLWKNLRGSPDKIQELPPENSLKIIPESTLNTDLLGDLKDKDIETKKKAPETDAKKEKTVSVMQYLRKKWEEYKVWGEHYRGMTSEERKEASRQQVENSWFGRLGKKLEKKRDEQIERNKNHPRKTWKEIRKESQQNHPRKTWKEIKKESQQLTEKEIRFYRAIDVCLAGPITLFGNSLVIFLVCCLLILIPIVGLIAAPIGLLACLGMLISPFLLLFNIFAVLWGKKTAGDVTQEQSLSKTDEVPEKEEEKPEPSE